MNTIKEVNFAIENCNKQIAIISNQITELRETYQRAKVLYENAFSRYLLETKAKEPDWTVQEVKALANNLSYDNRLLFIKAESQYRKAQNELSSLQTQQEGFINIGYNMRQELKTLNTGVYK